MSAESLLWLAHRLGPVLTARCLSRNLLRMLTLCYLRVDNLRPMSSSNLHASTLAADPNALEGLRIADGCVVGDMHANNVLNCLSSIVCKYENVARITFGADWIDCHSCSSVRRTANRPAIPSSHRRIDSAMPTKTDPES